MLPKAKIKPLKPNKGVYLLEDNTNLQQVEKPISKGVLAASKRPLKSLSESQQYDSMIHPLIKNKLKIGLILKH
jgi:hypothetical protein